MRRRIGLVAVIAALILLILVLAALLRGILAFLNGANIDAATPDPMFATDEAVERVTRPPQLALEDAGDASQARDRSSEWIYAETSPVDKTPRELAPEAR